MKVIRDVEGNDSLGDCVFAEEAHFIGVVTGNAGTLYAYTDAQTIAAYSAVTGYNPADPNTDQGADPLATLAYFTQNAYADGTKLAGYAEVDMSNPAEVMFAINAFGNLKMWTGLPDVWINPFPQADGFVWDAAPSDPENGHCIGSPAYNSPTVVGANSQGIQVMTWGMIGTVTWASAAKNFTDAGGGGAAVRVTTDWINKTTGAAPSGLAFTDLASDLSKLFGGGPVPAPTPSPAPPGTSPTLQAAQGWVASGIDAQDPLQTREQAIAAANAALASNWPSS
jgi:hypothetical protein